ncbi:MAG TPA: bacterial transcriptional activator domain-containing protein [Allosphingosinicella sp.]
MFELSLLILAVQTAAPEPAPAERAAPPITVNGLPERVGDRRVEQPYTEGEHVTLGSRIPRRRDERQFRTVATDTGLAGLLQGHQLNFDGTGGATPRFSGRVVTECVTDHPQVPERTACMLFRARQAIGRQEPQAAAQAIAPLLSARTLSGIERYYVGAINLELADATNDAVRREAAITMMVESGRMPTADRPNAMRILAQLAARRGDNGAAVARLERLVAEMPDEPRNHADLAWLYARSGRDAEAVGRMNRAVQLARSTGASVPQTWIDFLRAEP